MQLFQDIVEGRLLRTLSMVNDMRISGLAERVFEHLLALQYLAYEDPDAAAEYASDIMQGQNFNSFRMSMPDLYNFITLILRQDQYDKLLKKDIDITLPEFIIRRNLREIANGKIDTNDYNYMMLLLQRKLSNLNNQHLNIRRELSDYEDLTPGQQNQIKQRLVLLMRERSGNTDLYYLLYDSK